MNLAWLQRRLKQVRRRKKFHQEAHVDDCGSDATLLEIAAWTATLDGGGGLGAAIIYGFYLHQDCHSSSAEYSETGEDRILNDNFFVVRR